MPLKRSGIADAAPGSGPVLVVSPHLDDGVLACGCLLAGLGRSRAVVVATVFAGHAKPAAQTAWDRAAGFAPGADAVTARRAEDRKALALLGARPCWLPFRDSQYGPSPRVAAIAHRLASLPGCGRGAAVLFPLGLFHSDHRRVHDAVLTLLRRRRGRARWFAYEDALYRRMPGLRDAAVTRLRRAGLAPQPVRFAADAAAVRRKARAVACYASQLRALATPGRLGHADAFTTEGYWRIEVRRAQGAP